MIQDDSLATPMLSYAHANGDMWLNRGFSCCRKLLLSLMCHRNCELTARGGALTLPWKQASHLTDGVCLQGRNVSLQDPRVYFQSLERSDQEGLRNLNVCPVGKHRRGSVVTIETVTTRLHQTRTNVSIVSRLIPPADLTTIVK